MVLNEQSWSRDILAGAPAPGPGQYHVREVDSGRIVSSQRSGDKLVFFASRVPALSGSRFRIERGNPPTAAPVLRPTVDPFLWRTDRFELRFSRTTGAIIHLIDRRPAREWVDSASGYGLNQYLYARGGKGTSLVNQDYPAATLKGEPILSSPSAAAISLIENGPIRGVLRVVCAGPNATNVIAYVSVTRDGRIDLANVVRKSATTDLEAGYFAFPLKMDRPSSARSYFELPYGILKAEQEQVAGACREWYSAYSFAAVSDGRYTATVASPSAPLFTVGDVFRGQWRSRLGHLGGPLFSYAFNNYWDTNYCASQGGDLIFTYSLDLAKGPFDPVRATRFGWSLLSTLPDPTVASAAAGYGIAEAANCGPGPRIRPAIRLRGRNIVVGRITRDQKGLCVRLYNPSSLRARVSIAASGALHSAEVTDLPGIRSHSSPLSNHTVAITVRPRGIATIRLCTDGAIGPNKRASVHASRNRVQDRR